MVVWVGIPIVYWLCAMVYLSYSGCVGWDKELVASADSLFWLPNSPQETCIST